MRKNVGTIDASIRITIGLLGLAYGIGKMARRPYRAPWLLMALSAMKVAEGFTRYCPMLHAMGINTRKNEGWENMWQRMLATGGKMADSVQGTVQNTMGSMQTRINARKKQGQENRQEPSVERKMTASEHALESEIREQIVGTDHDDRHPSSQYSQDEHHYSTYS